MDLLFGTKNLLTIYIGSGILTNLITYMAQTSPVALGASSCAYGLLGAMGAYFYKNKGQLGESSTQGILNFTCMPAVLLTMGNLLLRVLIVWFLWADVLKANRSTGR